MTAARDAVAGKEGDRTRVCRTRTAVATVGSGKRNTSAGILNKVKGLSHTMLALQELGQLLQALGRDLWNSLCACPDRLNRRSRKTVINVLHVDLFSSHSDQYVLRLWRTAQECTHQQLGKDRADVGLVRQRHEDSYASLPSFNRFAEANKESRKVLRKQILPGRLRVSQKKKGSHHPTATIRWKHIPVAVRPKGQGFRALLLQSPVRLEEVATKGGPLYAAALADLGSSAA